MTDAMTQFVLKPAGPFAAGIVLFGVVWGFFKGVESVLNDDTKLEIADSLLGVKIGQKVESWPNTFAKVFDRVFGEKHISWRCFLRSTLASYAVVTVMWSIRALTHPGELRIGSVTDLGVIVAFVFVLNALPDYFSLLKSRLIIRRIRASPTIGRSLMLLVAKLFLTGAIGWTVTAYAGAIASSYTKFITPPSISIGQVRILSSNPPSAATPTGPQSGSPFSQATVALERKAPASLVQQPSVAALTSSVRAGLFSVSWHVWSAGLKELGFGMGFLFLFPAFFTTVWAFVYAGSGFLLNGAERFDISFGWFLSKADIVKKPLQSIGLVAGALVALAYWAAVIVSIVVG